MPRDAANIVDGRPAAAYCKDNVSTIVKGRSTRLRQSTSVRVNLRVDPKVKSVLLQAAKLQRVNLTEFMIRASQAAAEAALTDRTRWVLSPEEWREFNAALDARPKEIPALRKLFGESPFFKDV